MHTYRYKRQGCVTRSTPKHQSVCGYMDIPSHPDSRRQTVHVRRVGRVLQPGRRPLLPRVSPEKGPSLRVRCAWSTLFACQATLQGALCTAVRGSQFRSQKYQKALEAHRLVGSIRRVASRGDNAAMEIILHALCKRTSSTLRHRRTETSYVSQLSPGLNAPTTGPTSPLGRLTPIDWDTIMTQTAQAA